MHKVKSVLAGKLVKVKLSVRHPQVPNFGGSEILIADWWDRIAGKSWGNCDGNPACLVYAARTGLSEIPVPSDDEVLYGKLNGLGHLVHMSELEELK